MKTLAITLAAGLSTFAASTTVAALDIDDGWYLAPMGGLVFSDFGESRGGIDYGPALYLGFGKEVSDKWNLEVSGSWFSSDTNSGQYERQGWLGVNAQYFFNERNEDLRIFGLGGMTSTRIKFAGDTAYAPSAELGAGALYTLADNLDLRGDFRYVLDFTRGDQGAGNDIFYNYVITAGVNWYLGDAVGTPARPSPVSASPSALPHVTFPLDSAQLTANSKLTLDDVARVMTDNPAMELNVVGSADDTGPADYNLKLSERRVSAVVEYLSGRGVENSRLYPDAKGESRPVASNATPEGRQQNRRVDLEVR